MKPGIFILPLLLVYSFTSFAQPVYSPGIRADKETLWMTDSLRITPEQGKRIHAISLGYNQQMDKAAQLSAKQKNKTQQRLINKKDADLKEILNKEQYQKYYRREKRIRKLGKTQYTGPDQPM